LIKFVNHATSVLGVFDRQAPAPALLHSQQDESEAVYADEIRELMLEPARQNMVQGDARGGKGSR
jgi:hypothetical protein